MIAPISALLAAFGVILFLYIIRLVTKKKLLLSYSLLWILLSLLIVFLSLFPQPIYLLTQFLGIQLPSNFVFIIAIVCLMAICLSLSIIASRQTAYSKTLIQEIALLKKEIDNLKDSKHD